MKRLLTLLLIAGPLGAFAQFSVAYHHGLSFVGLGYEIEERFKPEFRIGTNEFFENFPLEAVLTYNVIKKEDYEFYAGAGFRTESYEGLVIPVGMNFYPWEKKNFGFHFEIAPIIGDQDILRGT